MVGKFYGLSIGPGDPELITLKALRILRRTPFIAVPVSRPGEESLALTVTRPYLKPEQEIIRLFMPMSRERECLEEAWQTASEELVAKLRQGKDVVFLTLGDAGLYSSYSYLSERIVAIAPEVDVETVPGVPSFTAAAARLNLPLAQGNEPLAIVPLLEEPDVLARLLPFFPNLVLLKAARNYDRIRQVLLESGRAEDTVFVSRCCLDGEIFSRDLEAPTGAKKDYLSLLLVKGAEKE